MRRSNCVCSYLNLPTCFIFYIVFFVSCFLFLFFYINYLTTDHVQILFMYCILGHYSTYCLMSDPPSPKRWMYFSDEQVRAVPEEDVLKSQAYMLFYERSTAQTK